MARLTLTIDEGEWKGEYLFRAANRYDLMLTQHALVVHDGLGKPKDSRDFLAKLTTQIKAHELCDKLIIRCAIKPKFVKDSPVELTPGEIPIQEVGSEDRERFGMELLKAGGLWEVPEELGPLSKTDGRSETSESSPETSAVVRAN